MTTTNIDDMQKWIADTPLSIPDLSGLGLDVDSTAVADTTADAAGTAQSSGSGSDGGTSASVDGGSVVSFVAGVQDQNRQDVLDSTLFAQFAANAQYNRQTQAQQWYTVYLSTLGALAWTVQSFNFQQYQVSSSSFKLDDVVLDIMKAAFTQDEYDVVKSSIDALKKLKDDDGRIKLFGHNAVSSNAGNFQIGAVTESNGAIAMHTLGAYFSSKDSNTDFLFVHYKGSDTKIFKGVQAMTLNQTLYGNYRSMVQQRLGSSIKSFILDVPLSAG
ncbi:hypothetical protein B5M42_016835 [Paenibacillus athensensis]|uniref:Uncharacterized protein n=1 Tax=Paenibacillus athensensis TaxID=1967502 RepID=A0A4Y8PZ30_9BACL|nr:hypothetical protein [Paenibacillus athensensis]MCD1260468.1 hypothetical protein [Paenibacillus athensensis]